MEKNIMHLPCFIVLRMEHSPQQIERNTSKYLDIDNLDIDNFVRAPVQALPRAQLLLL